jgi:hypothetical protein
MSDVIVNKSPENHHAKFSPSSFPMRSRCGRFEPDGGNRHSASGTAQHTIFAGLFEDRLPLFLDDITDFELKGLKWAFEQVVLEADSRFPIELERQLVYHDMRFDEIYFGTVDVVNGPNKIFDLKAGDEHAYWAQMAGYALANMVEHGSDYVDVTLLYSRHFKKVKYTISYKDAMMAVMDVIVKSSDPDAEETPNEFCHWCGRLAECSAIKDRANLIAAFQDWDVDVSNTHDPEQLSRALRLGKLLKKWYESIEKRVKDDDQFADLAPPGFKWKHVSGRRSITDALAAYKRSGLSMEAVLRSSTINMSRLEGEYAMGMGITKKAAKELVQTKMAEIMSETKPYRVLEEEKSIK